MNSYLYQPPPQASSRPQWLSCDNEAYVRHSVCDIQNFLCLVRSPAVRKVLTHWHMKGPPLGCLLEAHRFSAYGDNWEIPSRHLWYQQSLSWHSSYHPSILRIFKSLETRSLQRFLGSCAGLFFVTSPNSMFGNLVSPIWATWPSQHSLHQQ